MLLLALAAVAARPLTFLETIERGRGLVSCNKHDESDSSIEQCQDWCRYPKQCEYCKCRSCSMCKPCQSGEEGGVSFESYEDWCSVREHCSHW